MNPALRSHQPPGETPTAARGKVLVVDDDPLVLEVTRERLQAAGFEVHTRETSLGTSQWISEERPDLVLLDVRMPALSGGELAMMIRRSALIRSTGVVFYSGIDASDLDELARQTGALGSIPKAHDARRFIVAFERFAVQHKKKQLER